MKKRQLLSACSLLDCSVTPPFSLSVLYLIALLHHLSVSLFFTGLLCYTTFQSLCSVLDCWVTQPSSLCSLLDCSVTPPFSLCSLLDCPVTQPFSLCCLESVNTVCSIFFHLEDCYVSWDKNCDFFLCLSEGQHFTRGAVGVSHQFKQMELFLSLRACVRVF